MDFGEANLKFSAAITVSVFYHGEDAQNIKIMVTFYDESGRLSGFGTAAAVVNPGINPIEVPFRQYADSMKSMKILILNSDFISLSAANIYNLS